MKLSLLEFVGIADLPNFIEERLGNMQRHELPIPILLLILLVGLIFASHESCTF